MCPIYNEKTNSLCVYVYRGEFSLLKRGLIKGFRGNFREGRVGGFDS